MDSGNSGSIQSSSGGDEEYDSRAAAAKSISSFMNPLPPPHHQNATPTGAMFDPLMASYLNQPPQQPLQNTLLNLDMVWPKNIRSDQNCPDINSMLASSSTVQPFFGSLNSQLPALPFPPTATAETNANIVAAAAAAVARASSSSSSTAATMDQNQTAPPRNPKKRSRASRRAPTTVLTTDTTNFRAMVQEFTGIPSSPFTSSTSFPRSRFDLFGRSSPLDTSQPPFLLRPFAQKVQPQPPPIVTPPSLPPPFVSSSGSTTASLSSSLLINVIGSTSANDSNNHIIPSGSTKSNVSTYQIQPSELVLWKQHQPQTSDLLNMQNPIFTFQSLLQSPPKYPLINSDILISKPQGSLEITSADSNLKIGSLDGDGHFGLCHGEHVDNAHLPGLTNLGNTARRDNNQPNWGHGNGDQSQLRSSNNYEIPKSNVVGNGKLNFSVASSNFQGNKGSENVSAARGEGTRESWICSSD